MYILPPIPELEVFGIFDAGVPNAERIVLRPTQQLNLASFALAISALTGDDGVTPFPDQFLWLGERWISPPTWVVVFTGPGAYREGLHQSTGESVLELHWGRSNVVFGQQGIGISVLRIAGISTHPAPARESPSNARLPNPWDK